jgi:hypothetical protein
MLPVDESAESVAIRLQGSALIRPAGRGCSASRFLLLSTLKRPHSLQKKQSLHYSQLHFSTSGVHIRDLQRL